ncbi:alpha-galactosidase [Paenibacillus marchantiae]|uniref:alpha-galactosidase n=1 Tax=Paenibacillus marchantiae TaxID=3026433 RepID=UPI00237B9723|nr:alpha-galactosidase [Paenibacillus marchantiae]WDQ31119.1 alpha-galactosidase [Paenibacillus marchantiae]
MAYFDLIELPEIVLVQEDKSWSRMESQSGVYTDEDIRVEVRKQTGSLGVSLSADQTPVSRIALRWNREIGEHVRLLGDHWERSYGDLQWAGIMPDREMPWYFMALQDGITHGYGVKTGPASLCCWFVDAHWVTLVLDVRCGGTGVLLSGRQLEAAEVVSRKGELGETPFEATQAFCRVMCEQPVLPKFPVYGGNNWYYAYGHSSHGQILEDSKLMSSLATSSVNRPYMVIDDGWQKNWGKFAASRHQPWLPDEQLFPDMEQLARQMTETGVRPGMWFRPLLTTMDSPKEWLLNNPLAKAEQPEGYILDPSIPEVLESIADYVARYTGWGYKLLKHDFTTYDLFGRWGSRFGMGITDDGWHFADHSRTSAEIILALYKAIKRNAGDTLIIGCNTLSHLSAGIFEIQRTGDDTSGLQWERTRRMGINTLAFRMPQHDTLYAVDADCVGLTNNVDWKMNRQWLDVLSRSGTPLFVSADPKAMGSEQRKAVTEAFERAAIATAVSEPLDWLSNMAPSRWKSGGVISDYDWTDKGSIEACSGYFSWN